MLQDDIAFARAIARHGGMFNNSARLSISEQSHEKCAPVTNFVSCESASLQPFLTEPTNIDLIYLGQKKYLYSFLNDWTGSSLNNPSMTAWARTLRTPAWRRAR